MLRLSVLLICVLHVSHGLPLVIPGAALDAGASCTPLSSSVCSASVPTLTLGTLVYQNSTHSEATLLSQLNTQLGLINFLETLAPQCATQLRKYACLGFLSPCSNVDTQSSLGVIALPAIPCYNSCIEMQALCSSAFSQNGIPLPPCPPEQIIYDFTAEGGNTTAGNCTEFSDTSLAPDQTCPLSVAFFGKTSSNTSRSFSLTRVEPARLRVLVIVLGYFGFLENVLVLLLTGFNPKLRKWPGAQVLVMAGGQALLAFGCLMQSWVSLYDLHCNPNNRYRHLCKVQAFFIVVGLHATIVTWLVMTMVTAVSVWHPNPAAVLKVMHKYRYYMLILGIIPLAFIVYCCTNLGNISASIVCAVYSPKVEEQGMVWPLLVEVCLGTIFWIASFAGTLRAFGLGSLGSGRELHIYARLLLYELVAIIPSSFFVVPFEVYRNYLREDTENSDPEFITDGRMYNLVVLATLAACIAPVLFGTIFLLRKEHLDFALKRWRESRSGSGSGTTASASKESKQNSTELNESRF